MKHLKLSLILLFLTFASCNNKQVGDKTSQNVVKTNIKFTDVTKASGVHFDHIPTRTEKKHLPEIMGSGVGIADFNRDGSPDILLVNSGAINTETRHENAKNKLFINDGKGKFADKTVEWNLTGTGYGQGIAVGDFDNDGFTDVLLTNYEGDSRLLKNSGENFEDVTEQSGIKPDNKWATSAGFFDYDNDGDLDLYVVKYVDFSPENPHIVYRNRMQIYSTPIYYNPYQDQLWENDGKGHFTDATEKAGINKKGNGLALALGDIDKDGDTDIYVANDSDENHLWLNEGNGKFKEIAQVSGSAYNEFGKEEGSMGVDFSDVDGNGLLDIVVTNFQSEPTALYSQEKLMLFRDVSSTAGIRESALAKLKFGVDFFDADNDGDEDLLVANGHIEDNIDKNSDTVTFPQQNTLYENRGDGTFIDISDSSGDALQDKQVSRGLATADFDSDGDLDFVIGNNGGTAQIAFNETADSGNFVGLWIEGTDKTNRNAIGARLVAKIGDKTIEKQIMGSQSYLSVSDFRVLFGLGKATKIDELEIYWPGDEKQTLNNIQAGKYYYLKQGSDLAELKIGEKIAN